MKILIEGVDRSGKDFFGKYYSKLFNLKILKRNKNFLHKINFEQHPYEFQFISFGYLSSTLDFLKTFDNFVLSRFHISEAVYSEYYKRESYISFDEIDKILKKLNCELFLLEIDYDTYLSRLNKNEECKFSKETFENQTELFRKYFDKSLLKKTKVKFEDNEFKFEKWRN